MSSILFLGLLIGMQHALEADHIAAVASIASNETSPRKIVASGAAWGLGHTLTLMAVAGGALWFGTGVSPQLAFWLEAGVGVMLVLLGAGVLFRLWRERIHFHLHRHRDGVVHFHAHSHVGEREHSRSPHDHDHPRSLPVRSLLVGLMHGMAGSAALVVLTASSVADPLVGIAYIALFGLGSIAGMAMLSAAMAVPLSYTAKALTWGHNTIRGTVGAGTVALGAVIVITHI